jgi:hypothetical protein
MYDLLIEVFQQQTNRNDGLILSYRVMSPKKKIKKPSWPQGMVGEVPKLCATRPFSDLHIESAISRMIYNSTPDKAKNGPLEKSP